MLSILKLWSKRTGWRINHRHGKTQKSLQGKYEASSNGLAAVRDVTAALSKLSAAGPRAQSAPENLLTGPKFMRKKSFQKDSRLFQISAVGTCGRMRHSSALPLVFTPFLPCARVFSERDSW